MHVVLLKARLGKKGGLEKYARRIASGFVERGCDVTFLSASPHPSLPGIPVHAVETCRWPAFRRMEQYDQFVQTWLRNHRADIVFGMDRNRFQTHIRAGNGVHAAFLESRLKAEGRLKWLSCKINPLHRKILALERAAFEHPNLRLLFANSRMVEQELLRFYQINPQKIRVVHNGVEWEEMQPDFDAWQEQKAHHLQRLRLDPSRFHVLFLGNGYLRKGLDPLLYAFARIDRSSIHLSVVGKESRLDRYRSLASLLGISKQVSFFGEQDHIRPFYQLADALVVPSFYDPFANVTLEALAMGLFVVSSPFNGGSEILTPQNGLVLEDLDPDAIASSLTYAAKRPKTSVQATQIRESVRHFDFSLQLPQLIDACLHV